MSMVFHLSLLAVLTMVYLSRATTDCINGYVGANDTCNCFLGWMGDTCDKCGGRIRLSDSSGMIADDVTGSQYLRNTQCMFLIEAERPTNKVHLRLRLLHTECQWDYLHVFDGDSVFTRKLAAYTGDILEQLNPPFVNDSVPVTHSTPSDIVLSSTSSQLLIYFYTDVASQADGFEIDYWVDYTCPINCSEHGKCMDNGTCLCDLEWYGDFCDLPLCPNNCSANGECDVNSSRCLCSLGYGGWDCSVNLLLPFWSRIIYSRLPENLTLGTLARASHSAILWQDSMLIYSGYRFPQDGYSFFHPVEQDNYDMIDDARDDTRDEVLQYHFQSDSWNILQTSSDLPSNESTFLIPAPRYGHSAVLFNDTMYVFGGAKYPSEEIVDELWALDLHSRVWTPIFNRHPVITEPDNTSMLDSGNILSMVAFQSNKEGLLPLPVRSHTAHVVGSVMIVLFGLSSRTKTSISYVQEYNYDTGEWSAPPQKGFPVSGLMGHASVYNPETGLIYVEGGVILKPDDKGTETSSQLLTYNPVTHLWSKLSASGSQHYLHTMTMFGPILLIFGGCRGSALDDCFSNELSVYNTLCDTWKVVDYPGLPSNSSRYSHSASSHQNSLFVFGGFFGGLHHDMLRLNVTNCSIHQSVNECLNQSAFCAWSSAEQGHCMSVTEAGNFENVTYGCVVDHCSHHPDCIECRKHDGCSWSSDFRCIASQSYTNECSILESPVNICSNYKQCESCFVHGCQWNGSICYSESKFKELNLTLSVCPSPVCFLATSCNECTDSSVSCLWCASLNQCIPEILYPLAYIHGQCLGWVSHSSNCSGNCSDYKTCNTCQNDPHCGWCNDPSDTGLGECIEGGFTIPRNSNICADYGEEEVYGRWFFEICPACQCNGHSSCVNGSVCDACQNNTDGKNCEVCRAGYWGDSRNGGPCKECDCNGYNSVCDLSSGVCECLSFGVTGNHCELCDTVSDGDADNFCFSDMQVNFIYTYSVDMDRQQEGFFIVTPPEDKDLNFKFEITSNPNNQIIYLQLFVGKKTENLWVLTNLTDPITLKSLDSDQRSFAGFTSNSNHSLAQLFSFARPSLAKLSNFTDIFNSAVENDYTNSMWDEDTSLIIYLSNLTRPMTFKITVDQQDFLFLLYFFITFITCFSVLLTAFLLGWYVKQKITVRNLLRQQYIELQRRVARPFARMKLQVEKFNSEQYDVYQAQNASYVSVETCRDNKSAILSLFVRLPGNKLTGQPVMGRSGLCVGNTLVRVNPSKKSKENCKVNKRRDKVSTDTDTPIERSDVFQGRQHRRIGSTSIPV